MSRFADWRARRQNASRHTEQAGRWRPSRTAWHERRRSAPDTASHLSDGVVVQTRLVARLLGLRVLRVDGVVHLAPARLEPAGSARPHAPRPAWEVRRRGGPRTRSEPTWHTRRACWRTATGGSTWAGTRHGSVACPTLTTARDLPSRRGGRGSGSLPVDVDPRRTDLRDARTRPIGVRSCALQRGPPPAVAVAMAAPAVAASANTPDPPLRHLEPVRRRLRRRRPDHPRVAGPGAERLRCDLADDDHGDGGRDLPRHAGVGGGADSASPGRGGASAAPRTWAQPGSTRSCSAAASHPGASTRRSTTTCR